MDLTRDTGRESGYQPLQRERIEPQGQSQPRMEEKLGVPCPDDDAIRVSFEELGKVR